MKNMSREEKGIIGLGIIGAGVFVAFPYMGWIIAHPLTTATGVITSGVVLEIVKTITKRPN